MKYTLLLLAFLVCPGANAEEWKTYHDAKLGIEFQYPEAWSCEWEEVNQPTLLVKGTATIASYVGFQITPKNPQNLPIETWYRTTRRPDPGAHPGKFAGHPAMIVPRTKGEAVYDVYVVARPEGSILAVVTRHFPSDPTAKPTIERIISSCKFDK